MKFSKRTHWDTSTNPLAEKLAELKKSGQPLIHLAETNPTDCNFKYLQSDLLKPFLNQQNLTYEPNARGLRSTREAICHYYADKGISLDPDQIFVTANTSEAYSFVFKLLANPYDRILAPEPGYPILEYLVHLHDIDLERYFLVYDGTWQVDLASLESSFNVNPKAIMLVHPGNPTGNYILEEERNKINQWCAEKQSAVIADEVFFDYHLDDSSASSKSFAANQDVLTFTLSGVSKILGLPQMKLSWIVVTGPESERLEAIKRLEIISDTYLSACTPTQWAVPEWFQIRSAIQEEIRERILRNRRILENAFEDHKSLEVLKSSGGWAAILKMPNDKTDEEWALEFLEKDSIHIHPGYFFDLTKGSHLIISLLIPTSHLEEGVARILARCRS